MNKRILPLLICVLILISSFCIFSFAIEEKTENNETDTAPVTSIADGKNDFTVLNNLFSVIVPKGYPIIYDDHYSFFTERNNDSLSVDFYTYKNEKNVSVADIPDNALKEFSDSILKKIFRDYGEYDDVKTERTKVNGCNAILIKCEYDSYEDEDADDLIYCLSTKEVIYAVRFESFFGFPEQDIKKVLDTFSVSGTHFDGDSEIVHADFSNAPDITEQLKKDIYNYDKAVFDSDDISAEGIFTETEVKIVIYILAVVVSVPVFAAFVLCIVFIIKYSKKKKKINELEQQARYCFNNRGNYNNYNNHNN